MEHMEIPQELLERIIHGDVVVFIGWSETGSSEIRNILNEKVLAQHLAARVRYPGNFEDELYKIAEFFETELSSDFLIQYLYDTIHQYDNHSPQHYHTIAELPFDII